MDDLQQRRDREQLTWLQMKRQEYQHLMKLTVMYNDRGYDAWERWYKIVNDIISDKYGA